MKANTLLSGMVSLTISLAFWPVTTVWADEPSPAATPAVDKGTPRWLRRPSGDDIARAYPRAAVRQRLNGKATMRCIVGPGGRMTQCEILSESPLGMGFGDALLKLSPLFKLSDATDKGFSTEGIVMTVPVMFRVP